MKIQNKKLKYTLWVVSGAIILIVIGAHFLNWRMHFNDEDVLEFFASSNVEVKLKYVEFKQFKIRTISVGDEREKPCLIFCHGAPGSWDAFKEYMVDKDVLQQFNIISYDRPGYGGSSETGPVTSLHDQSECLWAIRQYYNFEKYLLVSHSYGCPIATWNAIDYPGDLVGNIILAPAIDPYTEKYFWFSGLFYYGWSRWIWPEAFQVAGDEKCTHEEELIKLEAKMNGYHIPTLYVHGMEDRIAPAEGNIKFISSHVDDSLLMSNILKEEGHLTIWTDKDRVKEILLRYVTDILN